MNGVDHPLVAGDPESRPGGAISGPAGPLPVNPQMLATSNWLLRRGKKPYYASGKPRSGPLDGAADLGKLVDHDTALGVLAGGKFTGLGFAINRGFQFIDLDGARDPETGKVEPWAQAVLDKAKKIGAYIEVSISGTGFHIIGWHPSGEPDSFQTHPKKPAERYTHGRYAAIGRPISAGTDPLPDVTELIELLPATTRDETRAGKAPGAAPPTLVKPGRTPMTWPGEKVRIPRLLDVLNPGMDYPEWIKVGMAIHASSGGHEDGLVLWDEWSQGDPDKYEAGECARMWSGFKANGGVGFGTLVYMAQGDEEGPAAAKADAPGDDFPGGLPASFMLGDLFGMNIPPTKWLVPNIIAPGLTLFAAPPKMGKSYFVMQMGMAVASGGMFLGEQCAQARVTYFDLEEWHGLLAERVRDIVTYHGYPRDMPLAVKLRVDPGEALVAAAQAEYDKGSRLIVVDLLAKVRNELNEDAKKNVYARDYKVIEALARFTLRNEGLAMVIVHHANKGNAVEWQERISGSNGMAGGSHANMYMGYIDGRGLTSDEKEILGQYRQFSVAGKQVKETSFLLEMLPSGGGWGRSDKAVEDVKTTALQAMILQVLSEVPIGEPTKAEEVARLLGRKPAETRNVMSGMARRGQIGSQGRGGSGFFLRKPLSIFQSLRVPGAGATGKSNARRAKRGSI